MTPRDILKADICRVVQNSQNDAFLHVVATAAGLNPPRPSPDAGRPLTATEGPLQREVGSFAGTGQQWADNALDDLGGV